jgi:hypothetical protein
MRNRDVTELARSIMITGGKPVTQGWVATAQQRALDP